MKLPSIHVKRETKFAFNWKCVENSIFEQQRFSLFMVLLSEQCKHQCYYSNVYSIWNGPNQKCSFVVFNGFLYAMEKILTHAIQEYTYSKYRSTIFHKKCHTHYTQHRIGIWTTFHSCCVEWQSLFFPLVPIKEQLEKHFSNVINPPPTVRYRLAYTHTLAPTTTTTRVKLYSPTVSYSENVFRTIVKADGL